MILILVESRRGFDECKIDNYGYFGEIVQGEYLLFVYDLRRNTTQPCGISKLTLCKGQVNDTGYI